MNAWHKHSMNTGGQEQPGSHVSRIVRMDPKAKFWVLPLVSPQSGLHTPVTEGSYSKLLGGTRQGEGMSCLVSPRPADGGCLCGRVRGKASQEMGHLSWPPCSDRSAQPPEPWTPVSGKAVSLPGTCHQS